MIGFSSPNPAPSDGGQGNKQKRGATTPEMGEIPERGWNFDGATNRRAHARRLLACCSGESGQMLGFCQPETTDGVTAGHCWIGGGPVCSMGFWLWSWDEEQLDCTSTTATATEWLWFRAYLYRIPRVPVTPDPVLDRPANPGVEKKCLTGFDLLFSLPWPMSHVRSRWFRCDCDYWQLNREGNFWLFFKGGEGKCDWCAASHYNTIPESRPSRYPTHRVVLSTGVAVPTYPERRRQDQTRYPEYIQIQISDSFGIIGNKHDMQTATQTFIFFPDLSSIDQSRTPATSAFPLKETKKGKNWCAPSLTASHFCPIFSFFLFDYSIMFFSG